MPPSCNLEDMNTVDMKKVEKPSRPLKAALALAELSKCRQQHGAVLMKNGVVLAAGTNVIREPVSDRNFRSCSVHAEALVISQAGTAASGSTIYVARINKAGDYVDSTPCKRCQGLMRRKGIKKVYHT